MKVLHTSDWHLGKRLEQFSRMSEQEEVMGEIVSLADKHKVDAVIICGDIYDTFNPPAPAVDLFYRTVKSLSAGGERAVIVVAGNHDSPDRVESTDPLAREHGIFLIGYPDTQLSVDSENKEISIIRSAPGFFELSLPGDKAPLRIVTTPYANEYRLRVYLGDTDRESRLREILKSFWSDTALRYCDNKGVNIMAAHLFFMEKGGEVPEEPEEERPILHVGGTQAIYTDDIPASLQYVALGHLHRKQSVPSPVVPVVYSGSPLAYSIAESGQDKYVVLVDLEPGVPAAYTPLKLTSGRPVLRSRFESVPEAVQWLLENDNALVELTIATESFLTAADRKKLYDVHNGIISIIPEIIDNTDHLTGVGPVSIKKSREALFKEYFKHRYAKEPPGEILDLFRELCGFEEIAP